MSEILDKAWEGKVPYVEVQFQSHDPKSNTGLGTLSEKRVDYLGEGKLDEQAQCLIAGTPGLFPHKYRVHWKEPVPGTDRYPRSPGERPYRADEDFIRQLLARAKEWQQSFGGIVIYRNAIMDSSTSGLVMVRCVAHTDEQGKDAPAPLQITKMASQVFIAEDIILPNDDPTLFFKPYDPPARKRGRRRTT
jgi:hypothetical protein